MSRRGQGNCLTFFRGLSKYDSLKHLLKATGPNVTKFLVEPRGAEGMKIYTIRQAHMTNMATMPIYGKNL